jgi:hypothetical protein
MESSRQLQLLHGLLLLLGQPLLLLGRPLLLLGRPLLLLGQPLPLLRVAAPNSLIIDAAGLTRSKELSTEFGQLFDLGLLPSLDLLAHQ